MGGDGVEGGVPGQAEERKMPNPHKESDDEAGRQRIPSSLHLIEEIPAPADLLRQRPDDESERHHGREAGRMGHPHDHTRKIERLLCGTERMSKACLARGRTTSNVRLPRRLCAFIRSG